MHESKAAAGPVTETRKLTLDLLRKNSASTPHPANSARRCHFQLGADHTSTHRGEVGLKIDTAIRTMSILMRFG